MRRAERSGRAGVAQGAATVVASGRDCARSRHTGGAGGLPAPRAGRRRQPGVRTRLRDRRLPRRGREAPGAIPVEGRNQDRTGGDAHGLLREPGRGGCEVRAGDGASARASDSAQSVAAGEIRAADFVVSQWANGTLFRAAPGGLVVAGSREGSTRPAPAAQAAAITCVSASKRDPSRAGSNTLKSKAKCPWWWGPDQHRPGPHLHSDFQCYIKVLDGFCRGSRLGAETHCRRYSCCSAGRWQSAGCKQPFHNNVVSLDLFGIEESRPPFMALIGRASVISSASTPAPTAALRRSHQGSFGKQQDHVPPPHPVPVRPPN